jgi:hypothetical protein
VLPPRIEPPAVADRARPAGPAHPTSQIGRAPLASASLRRCELTAKS